jgi:hypothetical protein
MLTGYYSEIDYLPLECWIKANSGQYNALREDRNKGNKENDQKAWIIIFNDFLKKVGVSEEYQDYLDNLRMRAELDIEYNLNRERIILNQINELTAKINKYEQESQNTKASIWKTLNDLSRIEQRTIHAKDIYTLQYFELLKQHANG